MERKAMMTDPAWQQIVIGEELLTAVRLLKTGLREVNQMSGASDFFHLPVLLLTSGFERMMKVVICCHHHREHGEFPARDIFPQGRRGHDLVWLLDTITARCFSAQYLARVPAARNDIAFLQADPELRALVQIFSDFGQSEGYYNLNVVLGEADPGPSPDEEWQRLEMEILQDDPTWKQRVTDPSQLPGMYEQVYKEMTIRCERLARSLSRLFTIGGLGDIARQISPHTNHFLFLSDSDLGTTDYAALIL
jgi:hypothetical protein